VHVPQYVPQGATSFSLKHPASAAKRNQLSYYSFSLVGWGKVYSNQPIFVSSGKVVAEPQLFGVTLSVIFFQ